MKGKKKSYLFFKFQYKNHPLLRKAFPLLVFP